MLLALFVPLSPAYAQTDKFDNPLGVNNPTTAIKNFLLNVIGFIVTLGGALAVAIMAYAGFKLILGGAMEEADIKKAKTMLLWAVFGLILMGMAATILSDLRGILFTKII